MADRYGGLILLAVFVVMYRGLYAVVVRGEIRRRENAMLSWTDGDAELAAMVAPDGAGEVAP
jgi:hypothetical protein